MPKQVDPTKKRSEFIAASWNVIAEQGFGAVSMRSVAAAAGCTTGALTHYFSDRHALLVEALKAAHVAARDRMASKAALADTDFQRLRGVLLESLPLDDQRIREWKVWLAFWGASMSDAALSAENHQRYDEWQQAIQRLLRPLSDNPTADAALLIALIDGLGLGVVRDSEGGQRLIEKQTECRSTIDRFLNQLLT